MTYPRSHSAHRRMESSAFRLSSDSATMPVQPCHTMEIANSDSKRRLMRVLIATAEQPQQRVEQRRTQRQAQMVDMAHVSTYPGTSTAAAPTARRIMKIIIKQQIMALITMR